MKNTQEKQPKSSEKTAKNTATGKPFTKNDPRINKEGRPKGAGISITTEIKRALAEKPEGQQSTHLELLIKRILKKAISDGDTNTIRQIWNYIDGMPMQKFQGEVKTSLAEVFSDFNDEQQGITTTEG